MDDTFLKKEGIDYISNFYRYKLYDKKTKHYLLTLDDGNFLFLKSNSFRELKRGKITDKLLYNKLEEKGIILTIENISDVVNKTYKRYSFLQTQTSLHIVVLTQKCNLSCVYCFVDALNDNDIQENNFEELTDEKAIDIVDFIMKSPSKAITIEFQGGEPLKAFDKIQLMTNHAKKLNKKYKKDLRLTVVTNLTLMTNKKADWLIENNISICTSLDGPKIVHDNNRYIRGLDNKKIGSYDLVVKWIKKINKKYKDKQIKGQVGALMTLTRFSLNYHKEIIDEYISHNLNVVDIRSLTQVGRANENENKISYSYEDFIQFYKNSLDYIDELNQKGIRIYDRIRRLYYMKLIENKPGFHADFESPCGAAIGNISYFSNGNIYTCNEAINKDEFLLGNVKTDSWRDIFNRRETAKTILNSMLESNVMCDRCIYKPYCGTCMVENLCHQGKFNFYPTKTAKHHETIMHSDTLFKSILNKIERNFEILFMK